MRIKCPVLLVTILILLISSNTFIHADNSILLKNSDFEELSENNLEGWLTSIWDTSSGATEFLVDGNMSKTGNSSAVIINHLPNDSRYKQEVKVRGNKFYKISCWARTENVGISSKGANISAEGLNDTSADIRGDSSDWQYIELYGRSDKNQNSFVLTLGLGGYGSLNTGKVWFDDVKVEEIKNLPQGIAAVNLFRTEEKSSYSNPLHQEEKNLSIFNALFILIFIVLIIYYLAAPNFKTTPKKESAYIYIILLTGLILRIISAPLISGHPIDIRCFASWSLAAANNLSGFYTSGMFVDYPPLYVYILSIIGYLSKALNLAFQGWGHVLLLKLPSILADIMTAYMLYKLSQKHSSEKARLFVCALYIFNPVVILNSTLWGQVDSFFTLLIVCALLLIVNDKVNLSSLIFAVAILMKPQGIIFLPILFFELVKTRKIKNFVVSFIYAIASVILVALPFSHNQHPLWIFKLYMNTAAGYKGASVNAFNLFALLGANWKDDSSTLFIFSYSTWGLIFISLLTLFVLFLYIKNNIASARAACPIIGSVLLNAGVFVLSSRMHERYMFPSIALTILAYIFVKDKRLLLLTILFSVTGFINTHMVFIDSLKEIYWIDSHNLILKITSFFNVLLLAYLIKVSIDIIIKNNIKKSEDDELSLTFNQVLQKVKDTFPMIQIIKANLIKKKYIFLLLLLLGITIRSVLWDKIPPGLNQDEASIGYDAYAILNYGIDRNGIHNPVHLTAWGSGQNALYAYFSMPFIYAFGLSVFSIRLVSLVSAIISLILFYLLAEKITDKRLALLSLFLLSLNPWNIMISRWALESNLFPPIFLLSVYLLVIAADKAYILPFSAFFFALCLYAYGTAYLVVPIFLTIALSYMFLHRKINAKFFLISALVFTITALPIFMFLVVNQLKLNTIRSFVLSIPRLTAPRYSSISSVFSREFFSSSLKNLLSFLKIMLTQHDGLIWNSMPRYGFMFLFGMPLACLGLWREVTRHLSFKKLHNKSENFNKCYIILAWLAASVLLAIVTDNNINRINIIFFPLIFLAASGIDFLRIKAGHFFIPIILSFIIAFSFFSYDYITTYPKSISPAFFESFGEAIRYASEPSTQVDRIYVTNQVNMPYIYVLFYQRTDPNVFLNTVRYRNPGGAFQWVDSFDRYTFGISSPNISEKAAYVVHNSEVGIFSSDHYNVKRFKHYSVFVKK